MSRGLPKPWPRTRANGKREWFVTLNVGGKQQQKLLAEDGPPDEEIQRRLLLLLNEVNVQKCEANHDAGVVAVINLHLDHVKTSLADKTYSIRSWALLSLRQHLEAEGLVTIACKQLQPLHITRWLAKQTTWERNARRMAISAVKTCFNWAYKQGVLKQRVLENLEMPSYVPRGDEVLLTAEQRRTLIDLCECREHKDVLIALYSSGCRPGEICELPAERVHLDRNPPVWVVKGKPTKLHPDGLRRVVLSPVLVAMSKRLLEEHPTCHLFRNHYGRPWNPDAILKVFVKLRERLEKLGKRVPDKLIPYGQRHNFATDLLDGGANDYDVAKLMGHADTKMAHSVYAKHTAEKAGRALVHLQEVSDDDGPKPAVVGSTEVMDAPASTDAPASAPLDRSA